MKSFMKLVVPLLSGLLFGMGLLISGMSNPAKVQGFLDIAGSWQPALIAVMAGAVVVFAVAFHFSEKMKKPWFHSIFHKPRITVIDVRLVVGAIMFGMGWALAGLCPGPALVGVVSGNQSVIIFVIALLVGNRMAHYLIGPAKV